MIEWTVKEFLQDIATYKNRPVTVIFLHRSDEIAQQITDSTYSLYLDDITTHESHTLLTFHNGMDGEAKSTVLVNLPENAICKKISSAVWEVEYPKNDLTIITRFQLPKIEATTRPDTAKPYLNEVRSKEGNLEKIIIDTPEIGANISFIENVSKIIAQILTAWHKFSISSVTQTDNEANKIYEYQHIETVTLPGNVFFEVQTLCDGNEESLEVATSFVVDLKASTISYQLDEILYTIRRVQ